MIFHTPDQSTVGIYAWQLCEMRCLDMLTGDRVKPHGSESERWHDPHHPQRDIDHLNEPVSFY